MERVAWVSGKGLESDSLNEEFSKHIRNTVLTSVIGVDVVLRVKANSDFHSVVDVPVGVVEEL